jgi:exonuclease VII large subunit
MIEKGYIPVFRDNKRVMSASALSVDDTLSMDFIDGKVKCLVKNIELTE